MNTTRNLLASLLMITLLATACGSTTETASTTTDPDSPSVVDQISLDEQETMTTSTGSRPNRSRRS